MIRRGETRRLSGPRRRLAAHEGRLRLARRLARRWGRAFPALAGEFESAALLAVAESAARYGRRGSFQALLARRLRGAMRDVHRGAVPRGWRGRRGGRPPRIGSLHGLAVEPTAAAEEPALDRRDAFEAWLRRLPPRHAEVVDLLFWHGYTAPEVARLKGRHRNWAHKMVAAAAALLRADPAAARMLSDLQ